jgi:hypothetical protein
VVVRTSNNRKLDIFLNFDNSGIATTEQTKIIIYFLFILYILFYTLQKGEGGGVETTVTKLATKLKSLVVYCSMDIGYIIIAE